MNASQNVSESSARRAAKRAGLVARKSRWRRNTADNRGGFMLVEPITNTVMNGVRFDLTADAVIEFCAERKVAFLMRTDGGGPARA